MYLSVKEVNLKAYTHLRYGLSEQEVQDRLQQYGYNELPSAGASSLWKLAWRVVTQPMFLLLVACAVLYLFLGDLQEALVLSASVVIVMAIELVQERKTERALEALKNLSSPRALVIRDGNQVRVPGREVVPDDLIILAEGDRVPADSIVLENNLLNIDESLLTGESVSVPKRVWDGREEPAAPGGDDLPFVYSGTLVVSGKGIAQVYAAGLDSELGKIGRSLQDVQEDETRLNRETGKLVRNFALFALFLCAVVVAVFFLTRGRIIDAFLTGITLAMSILPEEFPVILTVFLALGAWRMSKRNVLTRHSQAIENLGSATVLCTDKTGTLTYNKMTVQQVWTGSEPATLSGEEIAEGSDANCRILRCSVLACLRDPFDPMEKAIHAACSGADPSTYAELDDLVLVKEYPLSDSLRAMTNVWKRGPERELEAAAKGSPEAVLSLCRLDSAESELWMQRVQQLASDGLRLLGVASASASEDALPESQSGFDFRFLGLIALADPIRETVPAAIRECHRAGIRVIMITGDYVGTARSIGRQIGLRNLGNIITGTDLDAMSDADLQEQIRGVSIFARVVPEQKLRIVQALKASGEIVAMTGDGVNDAPALKAANIGISMGRRGTDVAREASALVLTDDDFSSIVSAVRMGRRIYDNLRKSFVYVFSLHVPIAGMSLIPALASNWPLIFFPIHIAFLELIIDPACSVVFEMEAEEADIMDRPPRRTDEPMFGRKMITIGFAQGLGVLLILAAQYFISLRHALPFGLPGNSEAHIRTYVFVTLVFSNLILITTNRSWSKNLLRILRTPNRAMSYLLLGVLGLVVSVTQVPALTGLFHLDRLSLPELLVCLLLGTAGVLWFEIYKLFRR